MLLRQCRLDRQPEDELKKLGIGPRSDIASKPWGRPTVAREYQHQLREDEEVPSHEFIVCEGLGIHRHLREIESMIAKGFEAIHKEVGSWHNYYFNTMVSIQEFFPEPRDPRHAQHIDREVGR